MARTYRIEADGGSRGNPGPAAFGTVVTDAVTGEVLAELAEYLGVATNNVAEYSGALAGLSYIHSLDPTARIEVRMDSKLVVEQMSGRWKIKHEDMRALAIKVRDAHPPEYVNYIWIPREENKAADALVNEVLDSVKENGSATISRLSEFSEFADVIGDVQEEEILEELAESPLPNVMVGWADVGVPTYTHLARHGATAYSLEKRFSGLGGADLPLAPIGVAQAEALALELAERGEITRIISSPLLRTQQTAQIVAGATGLAVEIIDDFAECSFGDWDGLTFTEVRTRWPDEMQEWLASTSVAPPGGESFDQCRVRVDRARKQVLARYPGEHVLVVAHVSPIKLLVGLAIDAPLHSVYRMELRPCSITSLAWFPEGNASMFSFSESSHLRGVEVPDGT